MIRHVCPACEFVLWSSPRLAGLPISCECCRYRVTVPEGTDESPFRLRSEKYGNPASPRVSRSWAGPLALGIVLLFAGGWVATVLALSAQRRATAPVHEPLTKLFVAKDSRSEIRVPGDWNEKPFRVLEEGQLKLGSLRDDVCIKVLTEPKVILGQTMNRDEYARLVADNMKRHLDSASVSGPSAIRVAGRPAVRYELTGRIEGVSGVFFVTVVEGEDHFHQIVAISSARNASGSRPLLENITQTFREVRPVASR